MERLPSALLENAVKEFSKLPGIGRKTALRLVLHLLHRPITEVSTFGEAVIKLRKEINYCKICNNICESEVCEICTAPKRDKSTICVVEDLRDIIAIEHTEQYKGLYHVLGGIINPIEGIGPDQLNISALIERVKTGEVKEIIMALRTTMEGDTTVFFIFKKLQAYSVKFSTIARGVAVGGELEYADEVTLGRAIVNRTNYENSLASQS
ncbi:MAG: recombination protein RecR [Bacteroidia bacterium]|nr:recombination mediator RecR [Bacteroidia bacterium]NNC84660.1 recombination protein RecR [Bacteroidia bacterium]NNM16860.1 recombination protein RecR [Bacteroidia bacterium]